MPSGREVGKTLRDYAVLNSGLRKVFVKNEIVKRQMHCIQSIIQIQLELIPQLLKCTSYFFIDKSFFPLRQY
jgi:hypothetical protein